MADDYAEQQSMELEALESILMDDMQELIDDIPSGWNPVGKIYRVPITPQSDDGGASTTEHPVLGELVFAHTPNYPDEAPLIKGRSLRGMTDADVANFQALLEEQVELNMGMPMIYTLIDAAQQWINDKALELATPVIDPALERKRAEEAEEARIAALRAHGTPVTPESFKEWKQRFDAELALTNTGITDSGAGDTAVKLTGKAWFLEQEAAHRTIEEPELEEDEEDGEDGDRSQWSEGEEEDFDLDELTDDDEDFLDEYLEEKETT